MATSEPRPACLSLKGFAENRVSPAVYYNELWPTLEISIDLMLNSVSGDTRRVSFEETYSTVYRIVCQGYGSLLFEDLMHKKIDQFIDTLDESLQSIKDENIKEYIERFDDALKRFNQAIQSILAVFVYLSRCVIEGGLNKALYGRLNERFISKHVHLVLEYLKQAESRPFAVEPSTFSSIIKTLYLIDEDLAKLNPAMFKRFIPGYQNSTLATELTKLSNEAKEMSDHLRKTTASQERSHPARKRPLEDEENPAMEMDDT